MKSVLFIINPHSGRNRNKQVEKTAMDLLSPDLFTVDFVYTRYAGHALELSRLGVAKGYDIILAVGGDGTIHEVSQSVIHSNSAMAVIPMGSGNEFARFFAQIQQNLLNLQFPSLRDILRRTKTFCRTADANRADNKLRFAKLCALALKLRHF